MTTELKVSALSGAIWSLVQAWGVRVITLSHFVIIARLLQPVDLGIIAFATAIVGALATLADLGTATTIESRPSLDPLALDSAWWATLAGSIVTCATVYVATPTITAITNKPYLSTLLPVLSVSVIFAASSSIQLARLKSHFKHRSIAAANLGGTLVGAIVGVACAVYGLAYWSPAIKTLVESAAISLLLFRLSPWKPELRFSFFEWKSLAKESLPVLGMRVIDIANSRLDALLVGAKLGPVALGFYSTGQRIYQIMMDTLSSAVNQVSLPIFGRVSQTPGRSSAVLLKLISNVSTFTFPAFALVAATGTDIAVVVFGDQWKGAGTVLSAFCVGGVLFSISYFNSPVMVANGRSNYVLWLTIINGLTNAAAYLLATPFGATAVAVAFVIRGYLVYPINVFALRAAIGISVADYLKSLVPATVSSVIAAVAAVATTLVLHEQSALARLPLSLAAGAVTYVVGLHLLFPAHIAFVRTEARSLIQARRAPSTKLSNT